jgi:uncharacterized protein YndB with AHSA1/START domain
MNNNLLFDFTVGKAAKTILITREFNARQSLVWDAFTKKELLDRWAAPSPMRCETKYLDFKVGGKRFYAMINPEGQERWVLQEYTSITPKTNFKLYNAFADKDENPDPTGSEWDHSFSEQNGITTVNISIYNESVERMQSLADGFGIGYTAMLENLDNLFATL